MKPYIIRYERVVCPTIEHLRNSFFNGIDRNVHGLVDMSVRRKVETFDETSLMSYVVGQMRRGG